MIDITVCPTCESRRIQRVRKSIVRIYKKKRITIPDVEYYECPDCGEELYDQDAMRIIEAHHPVYRKSSAARNRRVS